MKKFILKTIYITTVAFLCQFVAGNLLLNQRNKLLEETYFPIKRWKEFYSLPKNSLDLIFIGSSHCYRSFVPNVFDSTFNINSFNLGSSSQSVSTSFYVLKEALKTQSPQTVILEIHHSPLAKKDPYIDVLHNYPQIKSEIKYQMLATLKTNNAIELLAFPLRLSAINKDQLILKKKHTPDTTATLYSIYDHKGFVATIAKNDFHYKLNKLNNKFNIPDISPLQLNYLHKIIQLCRSKKIRLITITQPLYPDYWQQIKHINFYNKLDSILNQEGIPYFNFNEISPLPDSSFYDEGHILKAGAIQFSKEVVKLIEKENLI